MPYWNDLTESERSTLTCSCWTANPLIRQYINEQVTGQADLWTIAWFGERFIRAGSLPHGLVIGCGTGELERDLVRRGICKRVTALDIAPAVVAQAREIAGAEQLLSQIEYIVGDGRSYLNQLSERGLPAVFFHAALHHFDKIPELLALVASRIQSGGIFFADEFVGPSRNQWNPLLLIPANIAYYLLPPRSRRPGLVRAPISPQDLTECVCSDKILPNIYRYFDVLERRDYGGNLLAPIYPNLALEPGSPYPSEKAVLRLIRLERFYRKWTASFLTSFHSVIVARPRLG